MTTAPLRTVRPAVSGLPDHARLLDTLTHQHGVISRDQVLSCGFDSTEIRRRVRRREWTRVHQGVFINHGGPLTWIQRAWAAVLSSWPAALAGESAWRAASGPGRFDEAAPITVAVDPQRQLQPVPGVSLRPTSRLPVRVLWNASPPQMRFEDVTLDLAAHAATETDAVAWLAQAIRSRLTTAARLRQAAQERPELAQRHFLASVLRDVGAGTCVALEHAFRHRVADAHGLPPPRRPPSSAGRPGFFQIDYSTYDAIVELDGRLSPVRLLSAQALSREPVGELVREPGTGSAGALSRALPTVRLGWSDVFDTPCHSARLLASELRRHGWAGTPVPCSRCSPQPRIATPSRQ